ncbi:MAG TPA: hemolysin family protein [Planctomycetota bacterium]|nr:hemolysin family protein [Planctomycetota bacterium]
MGWHEFLIIAAMLAVNAVFAAYELALASVSLGRLRLLAEQGRAGAPAALAMKGRMEASLAVVQIGITLAGAFAAAAGGAGAEESIAPRLEAWLDIGPRSADLLAVALVVLPLSITLIIVGELVPKTLAIRNSEAVCLALGRPMRVFAWTVYPAVFFFEKATKLLVGIFERRGAAGAHAPYDMGLAELRAQARALRTSQIIDAQEERIILGASALTRQLVTDILVPAGDIVMLNLQGKLTEHFVVVHLEGYTRFPVTERPGDPDGITGYVNVKELVFLAKNHPADPSLRQILRPLVTLSPGATIGQAFSQMMREHVHLAVVREPGGRVLGMITLEDILEEIVGDIQDEFDRLPRHLTPAGASWVVGGGVTLGQLREALARPELGAPEAPETSFSIWLQRREPRRLKGGDALELDGLRVLIRKTRRQKVLEATVSQAK